MIFPQMPNPRVRIQHFVSGSQFYGLTWQGVQIAQLPGYKPGVTDVDLLIDVSFLGIGSAPLLVNGNHGDRVFIRNRGFVCGRGGNGGEVLYNSGNGQLQILAPIPGGRACVFDKVQVWLDCSEGFIGGGGGGGGAAWSVAPNGQPLSTPPLAGGGGGAGASGGYGRGGTVRGSSINMMAGNAQALGGNGGYPVGANGQANDRWYSGGGGGGTTAARNGTVAIAQAVTGATMGIGGRGGTCGGAGTNAIRNAWVVASGGGGGWGQQGGEGRAMQETAPYAVLGGYGGVITPGSNGLVYGPSGFGFTTQPGAPGGNAIELFNGAQVVVTAGLENVVGKIVSF